MKTKKDMRSKKEEEYSTCVYMGKPFKIVKEGSAEILFKDNVFYNKVQEFNRDMVGASKKFFFFPFYSMFF